MRVQVPSDAVEQPRATHLSVFSYRTIANPMIGPSFLDEGGLDTDECLAIGCVPVDDIRSAWARDSDHAEAFDGSDRIPRDEMMGHF